MHGKKRQRNLVRVEGLVTPDQQEPGVLLVLVHPSCQQPTSKPTFAVVGVVVVAVVLPNFVTIYLKTFKASIEAAIIDWVTDEEPVCCSCQLSY